jgi:tetratricopeptide (TPR) repeat protein
MRFFEPKLASRLLIGALMLAAPVAFSADRTRATPDKTQAAARAPAPAKHKPARLDVVDAMTFTITEQARISGDARSQYDSALRLLEQERYPEGIAVLLEVAQKAPDVTAPQINLGIAYERIGDFERAEASFKRALELNPSHPVAHDELGLLYRQTGRFAAARASYEKALEIHSGFHFAHRNLAILCDVYLNDVPCALAHYEAYSRAEPEDEEVQKWIADLRSRPGH